MAEDAMSRTPWHNSVMTPERWQAGENYIAALRELGFDPETTLWAFDETNKQFQLAFVTGIVDRVGTLDIYKVLFDAYEKAVTPQEFDPWVVALFSPKTFFASEFASLLSMNMQAHGKGGATVVGSVALGIGTYTVRREWIYAMRAQKRAESKHQVKAWKAFEANVLKRAA